MCTEPLGIVMRVGYNSLAGAFAEPGERGPISGWGCESVENFRPG